MSCVPAAGFRYTVTSFAYVELAALPHAKCAAKGLANLHGRPRTGINFAVALSETTLIIGAGMDMTCTSFYEDWVTGESSAWFASAMDG